MKTYTKLEVEALENNLLLMKENRYEVCLSDLNQDNLNKLIALLNIIGEEYNEVFKSNELPLQPINLEEIDEVTLNILLDTLIKKSEALLENAKENIKEDR